MKKKNAFWIWTFTLVEYLFELNVWRNMMHALRRHLEQCTWGFLPDENALELRLKTSWLPGFCRPDSTLISLLNRCKTHTHTHSQGRLVGGADQSWQSDVPVYHVPPTMPSGTPALGAAGARLRSDEAFYSLPTLLPASFKSLSISISNNLRSAAS